jgi:hypothetical protein
MAVPAPVSTAKKTVAKRTVAKKTAVGAKKSAAVKKQTKFSRGPKKKGIYQARRKSWPTRYAA